VCVCGSFGHASYAEQSCGFQHPGQRHALIVPRQVSEPHPGDRGERARERESVCAHVRVCVCVCVCVGGCDSFTPRLKSV